MQAERPFDGDSNDRWAARRATVERWQHRGLP